MIKFAQVAGVLALGIASNSIAFAQQTPVFNRVNCIKVRDGKGSEYADYLRDVTMKLAKFRVDSGTYSSVIFAQAVFPAGRSARCDYNVVYVTNGFPAEAPSAAQTEADAKKAGISMSRAAAVAKQTELSYLMGTDLWRSQALVGGVRKGGYVRVNYYKSKPGMQADWVRLETTGWKQLAESVAKDMPGTSWAVFTLTMPGGTSQPYDGFTVDGFPSWEALGKGFPVLDTWRKVHPEMDFTQYAEKLAAVVDRPRIDVMKIVDVIAK